MISILLVSSDLQKAITYASSLYQSIGIHALDVTVIQLDHAIGIEDIRTIQKKLFLKPFKSTEKAIIIPNIQTASTEAQNALLKSLEEPPNNTSLVLITDSLKLLLPTILSRCKIQLLDENNEDISDEKLLSIEKEMSTLRNASLGERLAKAQKISENKEQAILWLITTIHLLRKQMLKSMQNNHSVLREVEELEQFQEAYKYITSTNIGTRMIFEDLFLQLEIKSI